MNTRTNGALHGAKKHWLLIVPILVGIMALIGVLFLSAPSAVAHPNTQAAPAAQTAQPVAIYFFWGDGCPHCAAAKPVLAELTQKYPSAQVRAYEVWYVEENQILFKQMAAAYGFEPSAVPTIFIGDRHWVGYAEQVAPEIEAAVAECAATGCRDAGMGIIPGIPTPVPTPIPTVFAAPAVAVAAPGAAVQAPPSVSPAQTETAAQLVLPWFGAIDLAAPSLAVSTALIALVDGFNPCSLWVLSVLLALTLNSGSRRRVFLVGFVFLTVTSLVYMAFITGLFTMFTVISFVGWIQIVVAVVALFFAAVNIKDYFWYKEGISLTIADEQKPGIYRGMRRILNAGDSTWGVVGATVVLAAGVSLVEFSCTAGFPVLWTNLLIAQQATALTFGLLLLLYMFIYQLDELAILLVAVFTLKASKLEEKQGRVLKLIGGMLMLTLAMVMLVNPAWMSQISSSLIVFGVAFVGTLFVLLVHRKILPRFGIRIGTELAPATRKHGRKHPRQPAAR